jgi:dextranase
VLAAYLDPDLFHNVLLADAVIFASGGNHIELGEVGGMLADPYFPKYQNISPELAEALRGYYDFAVRYQGVFGPSTEDATLKYRDRIIINGTVPSPSQLSNKIWPLVRDSDQYTAVNLINLLGVRSPEWAREIKQPPEAQEHIDIQISGVTQKIDQIFFASPDGDTISLQEIDFKIIDESGERELVFSIPYLEYWDLILIKWED